jgi:hypothetical protein
MLEQDGIQLADLPAGDRHDPRGYVSSLTTGVHTGVDLVGEFIDLAGLAPSANLGVGYTRPRSPNAWERVGDEGGVIGCAD